MDRDPKRVIESQRIRLEKAIANLIEEVYKSHFRKLQKDMHLCAATCCSDERGNIDSVQNCIGICTTPLIKAQDYLQHEVGQFQGHLQGCIMDCYNTQEKGDHYETCMSKCVDQHICLIPKMMKSIQSTLSKGSPKSLKSDKC